MRTLLLLSMVSLAAIPSSAQADSAKALEGLEGSRYGWMTDALDMQGGGTTLIEMLADKVIEQVQNRWNMQNETLQAFKLALRDPLFRSVADEIIRLKPENYISAVTLIKSQTQNPIIQANFANYGVLSDVEEMAFGHELKNYGYLQRIYNGATDSQIATFKLWRQATSPLEEQLKYSASYRYGID
ncbi:MAG: hypothetical protein K0M45_06775 [Candidatus Paracaedibacteraceae bacterium]|nr:hypothetical protein [Candidatus Paracaedibacteraceae bacterium]